jgi:hypothetical protein
VGRYLSETQTVLFSKEISDEDERRYLKMLGDILVAD